MASTAATPRRGLRSWWYDDPAALPGRLPANTPQVLSLARSIAPSSDVRDLGGSYSLNLHLEQADAVLRVHQSFVTRRRLLDLQAVRRHLAEEGVLVPAAQPWSGRTVFRCAGRWAELDAYLPHPRRSADVADCATLMADLGRLDRRLAGCTVPVTRPVIATWATPSALRRWVGATRAAVTSDEAAAELAGEFRQRVEAVARRWVPLRHLPQQLVHGDGKPDNLPRTEAGDLVVLDLGFAARRPRIHELAYTLNWAMSAYGAAATAHVPDWIGAYESGVGGALTPAEREALPVLGAAIALYRPAVSGYTNEPVDDLLRHAGIVSRVDRWLDGGFGDAEELGQTSSRKPSTRSRSSPVAAASYDGSEESVNRWASPG